MKKYRILTLFFITILLITSMPANVFAAEQNVYPQWQTIDGITTVRCTWYAWQQAYDNTGVALPNFGNAGNWYSAASAAVPVSGCLLPAG